MLDKNKSIGTKVRSLVRLLASKDGLVRQDARRSLVAIGRPAVSSLVRALRNSKSEQVRWEAAKALGAIGDTRSIPSLVSTLTDSDFDVGWVAAESLRQFKKDAWPALMRALVRDSSDTQAMYQGAHHVLRGQKEKGYNDLLAVLLRALGRSALSESAIVAAHEILERLKAES
ncbi:hypothetical protein C3F09_12285 [candidate division GN15 bacterium]|uniref:HEAT repeat domain-containing protein n=1 Tax=candidate division GN15 bacterium TaxID=2072418 RepID=A0A855X391_9BACT|nr:MAG: hypothetical protein C3F09_12285 [candidate division GN15 bacterium]